LKKKIPHFRCAAATSGDKAEADSAAAHSPNGVLHFMPLQGVALQGPAAVALKHTNANESIN
jgi:hypothetical protein